MKYTQTFAEAYRQVRLRKELSEDHEVSMAIGQLKTIQDNLNQLMSILQTKGSDYELEAWVQSKITSANDKMTSATDYMKNSPSVSEAVKEKDEDEKSNENNPEVLKKQIADLVNQVDVLNAQLQQTKMAAVSIPMPNPMTGEIPLRTGIAGAILDKKGPKPKIDKEAKSQVKLSKKKSKIEINPDVEMGVFSGGNKMNQGNLY